jgi:esterase/lipase
MGGVISIGSTDKTLRFFHRSGHNITVDGEREVVWCTVGDFVARVTDTTFRSS